MLLSSAAKRRNALYRTGPAKESPKAIKPRDVLKSAIKQPSAPGRISKTGAESKPPKKKVSIGGLFKNQPAIVKEKSSHHTRRHKRPVPEHELFHEYQDSVADARDATLASAKTKITEAHEYLLSLVTNIENQNATFKEKLEGDTELVFSSLNEEKVQTTTKSEDGLVTKTVEIGRRLAAFKTLLKSEKRELETCWAEWEGVQKEIVELGVEVLGENVAGLGDDYKGKSRKSERDIMDSEFDALVDGIEEEFGGIEKEFLEKMAGSEKEIALRAKNERNKFLTEFLAGDD